MSPAEVEVLLLRSAGWLLGIDADAVVRITSLGAVEGRVVDLDLLLAGGSTSSMSRSRCLSLENGMNVAVSAVLEAVSMPASRLQRLPEILKHVGAPDWWLGTAWQGNELMLLVDIIAAARVASELEVR